MKSLPLVAMIWLLLAACSSRVQKEAATHPVIIDKSNIDLADSAPISTPGATTPSTNWVCMLRGKTSKDRNQLLGLQGRRVEIRDGGTTLNAGQIMGTTVSERDNKAGLRIAAESPQAAEKLYGQLGIWPTDNSALAPGQK